NMSKSFVACLHEVEKIYGRFEIIHGHDWHVVDALHDLKQEGRKTVLTFHSTEYGRNGGQFGEWWEFKEISGKEWYGGYIADRVTTVSNAMRNELAWLYKVPVEKVDVIPNAIDPRKYQMKVDPGRIKEKYGIHPLAPTVLYVGRLCKQKGPDLLVEAIPQVLANRWDVKFVFAGEGGMRDYLQRRAWELGVGEAVRFPGYLDYWRYVEILNSADIVCIPSRNEPFGLTLLEAMSTGRAIVVTDVGGLGENIENFVDGVKVYPTPDSIAWGINYLLNNPEAMREMSSKALEKVKQFSWSSSIEKLMQSYRKALGQ
ncbi:MAG: glycosyltransferase family 4 protein, partial [Candidatus Hadarchaeales archaeon]